MVVIILVIIISGNRRLPFIIAYIPERRAHLKYSPVFIYCFQIIVSWLSLKKKVPQTLFPSSKWPVEGRSAYFARLVSGVRPGGVFIPQFSCFTTIWSDPDSWVSQVPELSLQVFSTHIVDWVKERPNEEIREVRQCLLDKYMAVAFI